MQSFFWRTSLAQAPENFSYISRGLSLVGGLVRGPVPFDGSAPDDAPREMVDLDVDSATEASSGDEASDGDEGGDEQPRADHNSGAPSCDSRWQGPATGAGGQWPSCAYCRGEGYHGGSARSVSRNNDLSLSILTILLLSLCCALQLWAAHVGCVRCGGGDWGAVWPALGVRRGWEMHARRSKGGLLEEMAMGRLRSNRRKCGSISCGCLCA